MAGHSLGGLALADDVMLLSPSVQGLQELVSICEKHARETELVFSTDKVNPEKSKTMCIAFMHNAQERGQAGHHQTQWGLLALEG